MLRSTPYPVRGAVLLLALLCVLLLVPAAAPARRAPLIAAAGDIACGPPNPSYNDGYGTSYSCQQLATSNMLARRRYAAVLPLGDLVYDDRGSLASYAASYEPSWGRFKAISHPVIGNHEYDDGAGATGYWDYWNGAGVLDGRAGTRGQGWYAYNVGSWRLIALNSNCRFVSCRGSSRQLHFLRDQLERNRDRCVLAYFHHPRFSSGANEDFGHTGSLWKALYRGGADVVLNGHEHIYERFAPQRPSGIRDHEGITEMIAGTGGYFLFPVEVPPEQNSQFTFNGGFGILSLRLAPERFDWSFNLASNGASIDHGRRRCHREKPEPHVGTHKHHRHARDGDTAHGRSG
jgi:hypothetical protein